MQPIPDTGGGLSGFLAYWLWHLYRHFPLEGTWDWLLLFVSLALVIRVSLLPFSCRFARRLSRMREYPGNEGVALCLLCLHSGLTTIGPNWLLIWFFSTPAGQAFLDGRTWFGSSSPLEVGGWFFWVSAAGCLVLGIGSYILIGLWFSCFPQDELGLSEFDEDITLGIAGSPMLQGLVALLAHVCYWHWSVASLVLLLAFTLVDAAVSYCLTFAYYVYLLGDKRRQSR